MTRARPRPSPSSVIEAALLEVGRPASYLRERFHGRLEGVTLDEVLEALSLPKGWRPGRKNDDGEGGGGD